MLHQGSFNFKTMPHVKILVPNMLVTELQSQKVDHFDILTPFSTWFPLIFSTQWFYIDHLGCQHHFEKVYFQPDCISSSQFNFGAVTELHLSCGIAQLHHHLKGHCTLKISQILAKMHNFYTIRNDTLWYSL